jgi:hypothetical protein
MMIAGIIFLGCNIIWAYGNMITKKVVNVNAVQINFHLGVFIMMSMGILYPTRVLYPV